MLQLWTEHKESMLKYIEATHYGIKGYVLDNNRNPVPGAEVRNYLHFLTFLGKDFYSCS